MNKITFKSLSLNHVLLALTLISISAIGFFAPFTADDYCLTNLVEKNTENSILASAYELFMTWSGRAIPNVIWSTLFYFESLGSFFNILFAGAFSVLALASLSLLPFKLEKNAGAYVIILCGFWLAYIPYLGETVYWQTGAVAYILPLLWFVIWLKFYHSLSFINFSAFKVFLLFISSLIVAANHTQLTVLALAYLTLDFFIKLMVEKSKPNIKFFILAFIGLVLGGLIEPLSPGASARSVTSTPGFGLDIWTQNAVQVYTWVFAAFKKSFIIFLGIGAGVFLLSNGQKATSKKDFILWFFKWLIPGLLSMTPFIHFRSYLSERTFVYFVFPAGVASIGMGFFIASHLVKKHFKVYHLLPMAFFLTFSATFIYYFKQAFVFHEDYQKRESLLAQHLSKGEDFTLLPLETKPPRVFFYEDIVREQSGWIKLCVYDYYKLKK